MFAGAQPLPALPVSDQHRAISSRTGETGATYNPRSFDLLIIGVSPHSCVLSCHKSFRGFLGSLQFPLYPYLPASLSTSRVLRSVRNLSTIGRAHAPYILSIKSLSMCHMVYFPYFTHWLVSQHGTVSGFKTAIWGGAPPWN